MFDKETVGVIALVILTIANFVGLFLCFYLPYRDKKKWDEKYKDLPFPFNDYKEMNEQLSGAGYGAIQKLLKRRETATPEDKKEGKQHG